MNIIILDKKILLLVFNVKIKSTPPAMNMIASGLMKYKTGVQQRCAPVFFALTPAIFMSSL
jgi:hypothetical protein